jgi:hypothetical protein
VISGGIYVTMYESIDAEDVKRGGGMGRRGQRDGKGKTAGKEGKPYERFIIIQHQHELRQRLIPPLDLLLPCRLLPLLRESPSSSSSSFPCVRRRVHPTRA